MWLYHQPYNESINSKQESIQYNATLAITGAIKRTSRSKLYKELGLEFHDGLLDVFMHFEKYIGLSLSRLLSISNFCLFRTKSSVPWTFVYFLSYFYLFISYFSISNFSLSRTKILSLATISLSISNFFSSKVPLTQQIEQKCSIFENSNVIKTFEIRKFDCNQNITKCKGFVLN